MIPVALTYLVVVGAAYAVGESAGETAQLILLGALLIVATVLAIELDAFRIAGAELKSWLYRYNLDLERRNFERLLEGLTPEERRRAQIAFLRRQLEGLGIDTSHLTDDEIEESVVAFAKVAAATGITVQEAAEALRQMGKIGVSVSVPDASSGSP